MILIRKIICLIAVFAIVACLAACTAYRTVHLAPDTAKGHLNVGDHITVSLKNGRRFAAVVKQINSKDLVTAKARYRWSEVASVTRKDAKTSDSVVLSIGTVIVGALAFMVLFGEEVFESAE